MEAAKIRVTRTLPIDAALLGDVLVRLRRDAGAAALRWSLGDRGTVELDPHFVPVLATPRVQRPTWATTARFWDPDGLALVPATVDVTTVSADRCDLTACPSRALPPWWERRLPALLDLAHAAVDEIGEELLWFATRPTLALDER